MNLEALGRNDWLRGLPDIYRQQDHAKNLHLLPFFQEIAGRLSQLSRKEQQQVWYQTGHYSVANAWQLAFFWDVKRAFRRGLCSGSGRRTMLRVFDHCLFPLIDHFLGYWFAGLLMRTWFRSQLKGVSRSG
jgi:hypothetical protein